MVVESIDVVIIKVVREASLSLYFHEYYRTTSTKEITLLRGRCADVDCVRVSERAR